MLATSRSICSSLLEHGSRPASRPATAASQSTAARTAPSTIPWPNSTAISRKSSRQSHQPWPISSSTAAAAVSRPFAHARSAAVRSSKHVVSRGFLLGDPALWVVAGGRGARQRPGGLGAPARAVARRGDARRVAATQRGWHATGWGDDSSHAVGNFEFEALLPYV